MSTSTEPNNVWDFVFKKPASSQASQDKKKTIVTNYVKGQSPDASLPKVATGGVVPLVLGRDIIKNPDIIWYGNLKAITTSTTKQTTVTNPTTGAETITNEVTIDVTGYSIDVQLSLGVGPGMRLRSIYVDEVKIWSGTIGPARTDFVVNDPVIKNVAFAGGNFDQGVDAYIQALVVQELPAYRGIAYVLLKTLDTSKLGNLSFEVDRYPDPLGLGAKNKIGEDINPASAMVEIITQEWGGAGRDIATIGASFTTLANLLYDEANGCSIVNKEIVSANDLNSILLAQCDATMWVDYETGKIEVTPFRKDFDRANLVRLFDKDISRMDDLEKGSWQGVPTSISIKYNDRLKRYAEIPIRARNLAISGGKVSKSGKELSFPAVRVGTLAAQLLAREGATSGSPTQLVQFTTNTKAGDCNPGDIILLTYELYGYYSVPAIVVKRRKQPVDDNSVTLTCNVILYPNNTILFAAPEDSFFIDPDPAPSAPTDAVIMSAPFALRATRPVLKQGVGASADDLYVGEITSDQFLIFPKAYNQQQVKSRVRFADPATGTNVVVNSPVNDHTDDFIYPIFAKLTTPIGKYDNWDGASATQQIVIHDMAPNDLAIRAIQASLGAKIDYGCLIIIDDEVFTISGTKDSATAAATFNLGLRTATFTAVRRGACDTVAQAHAANANVFVFNVRSGDTTYRGFPFGVTSNFLLTGLSQPKGQVQESDLDIALAKAAVGTNRANRPLRPHNTKIDGARTSTAHALTRGASSVVVSWLIRARNLRNDFVRGDFAWQTDASQDGEVVAGKHLVYRVKIIDSAAVEWDCGATADTADHTSLSITVPAGAAAGAGWLYVQSEFDPGAGLMVSQFQDRLPVTLA